jgi:hypothetical protein
MLEIDWCTLRQLRRGQQWAELERRFADEAAECLASLKLDRPVGAVSIEYAATSMEELLPFGVNAALAGELEARRAAGEHYLDVWNPSGWSHGGLRWMGEDAGDHELDALEAWVLGQAHHAADDVEPGRLFCLGLSVALLERLPAAVEVADDLVVCPWPDGYGSEAEENLNFIYGGPEVYDRLRAKDLLP